ncbi:MAG: sensor histidine kinase [Clostridiaceae bacterium]|jgi:two-component system sensor histidine kinase YesM|nr:sensor histidine kinase [Clostridiaceae bacterium]
MRNNLKREARKIEMQSGLWKMIMIVAIPLMVVIIVLAVFGIVYALRYNAILSNVTTASNFNQNYKDDVDLKMYYYVIDSQYSEGLPIGEVESAKTIAQKLLDTTTQKDSIRAVNSVLNLTQNLEKKMNQIAETEDYDSRVDQLEKNIYIITDLIQRFMYTYLYYEAAYLNDLQTTMIKNVFISMVLVVILSLVLLYFLLNYSRKLSRRIVDPIDRICERLEAIGKGSLLVCEPIQADVEEVQILSYGIENMVQRLKWQIDRNTEQEKQRRRTELALLQAQINPHFLYNTLDTIVWLIESGEIDGSVKMVASLSNYFRFSLSRGKNVITLQEEEQHIRSYLEIQQMRYRDLMDYEIDIPDRLKSFVLPKLTLQPLVENALYHGVKNRRCKGLIRLTGREEDNCVILEVMDDGRGMTKERLDGIQSSLTDVKHEGFGLRTVHQRIQILFGAEYGLSLESTPDIGTKIIVRIPMQTSDKEIAT